MNSNETRWAQGKLVLKTAPHRPDTLDITQLIRDTDYVILQMMGKIAHRYALLPRPDYSKWPYPGGSHA